jgi:adenylate cyclase
LFLELFVGPQDIQRRLTAILSADVKGYSRLMGEDEAATVRTLTAYREAMASLIDRHRGRVVDSPGDNLLAEFGSVVDAVQCAVEIQRELGARNAQLPQNRRMEFRIGVNLGDVIVEGNRIYGDGINIAARIESLADAGGVCISGSAYEQIEDKLALPWEYMGEQAVKNIRKPVRVYRVLMGPQGAAQTSTTKERVSRRSRWRPVLIVIIVIATLVVVRAVIKRTPRHARVQRKMARMVHEMRTLDLPDKPSVAVLPFANMSGDPDQEYFSDGITEDLITDLSKIPELFVISRNSVFTYKGKAVNPTEVSKELGVRYILEGSVRKAEEKVRITAQLIDATTGGHLWAERYDRDLEDIFTLQDEVADKIVTALVTRLTETAASDLGRSKAEQAQKVVEAQQKRESPREVADLRAYDYFWRGRYLAERSTKEANDQARSMFEKAIALDPQFAAAYMGLGWTHYLDWSMQWSQDPRSLDQALELAQKALTLNDSLAPAHSLLGHVYLWKKQYEEAIAESERAIALEPNAADGYSDLAEVLIWAGRPEEAIGLVEKAMRLNPHYPVEYLYTLGYAYFATGQYPQALAAQQEAVARNPDFLGSHMVLVAIHLTLGQEEEARAHLKEVLRISPNLSLDYVRQRLPLKDPAQVQEYTDALRKLGLE